MRHHQRHESFASPFNIRKTAINGGIDDSTVPSQRTASNDTLRICRSITEDASGYVTTTGGETTAGSTLLNENTPRLPTFPPVDVDDESDDGSSFPCPFPKQDTETFTMQADSYGCHSDDFKPNQTGSNSIMSQSILKLTNNTHIDSNTADNSSNIPTHENQNHEIISSNTDDTSSNLNLGMIFSIIGATFVVIIAIIIIRYLVILKKSYC